MPSLLALWGNDAPGHHGDDEIALARGLGIDDFAEAQASHGRQHRLDLTVCL
jgi:hypothetical protein